MTITFVKAYRDGANRYRSYETDDRRVIDIKVHDAVTGETLSDDEAMAKAERAVTTTRKAT